MNEIKLAIARLIEAQARVWIASLTGAEHHAYMLGFDDGYKYAFEDEDVQ